MYLTGVRLVLDSTGKRLDVANPDGSRGPVDIQLGSNLTASWVKNGDGGKVVIEAAGGGSVTGTSPIVVTAGVVSITAATGDRAGSMSGADKAKLDGLGGSTAGTGYDWPGAAVGLAAASSDSSGDYSAGYDILVGQVAVTGSKLTALYSTPSRTIRLKITAHPSGTVVATGDVSTGAGGVKVSIDVTPFTLAAGGHYKIWGYDVTGSGGHYYPTVGPALGPLPALPLAYGGVTVWGSCYAAGNNPPSSPEASHMGFGFE